MAEPPSSEWTFMIPEDCTTDEALGIFLRGQLEDHDVKPGDRVRIYLVPPPPEGRGVMKWWVRLLQLEEKIEARRRAQLHSDETCLARHKVLLGQIETLRGSTADLWARSRVQGKHLDEWES